MIQSLRKKFVLATMISLALVLAIILGVVNLITFLRTTEDADLILDILSGDDDGFPRHMYRDQLGMGEEWEIFTPRRNISAEMVYESRFFSVTTGKDGEVWRADMRNIGSVSEEAAAEYAVRAVKNGKEAGYDGIYRYHLYETETYNWVIFLDCGRSLHSFKVTLLASVIVAGSGLLAVFVLLVLISGRIVKPVAESYEKQRQFITDAGHEIKTPLTIISADADLLTLDCGENEWLDDIRRQVQRMTGLTNDLISLSRMDEARPEVQLVEFPVSDVVEEAAQSFQSRAKQQGKALHLAVEPMLSLYGSEKEIRQLVSILLDNALKYSPEDSEISLRLEKDNKQLRLCVENATLQTVEREKLSHLFDRFYRLESSHNASTGGYGLGLAIAKSIVTAHHGKIRAACPEDGKIAISALIPMAHK